MPTIIHPSAIVDEDAVLGDNCRIWHFVHISAGARIGERCSFGQNVKIQNNISVYDAVTLEDDVFCGPSMVITNVYNPRSAVTRKDEYRRTLVKQGATLGANCTIVCGTTIGRFAFVGAGSVVNRDLPDFALVVGVPGRQIGCMSRFGERLELPLEGEAETTCPHTGDRCRLQGKQLSMLPACIPIPSKNHECPGSLEAAGLRRPEEPVRRAARGHQRPYPAGAGSRPVHHGS